MMIKSSAFNSILNLYCQKEKIEEFQKKTSIYRAIFDNGKNIGILKLANKQYNLGLVFKPQEVDGNQLKYKEFISDTDLSFLGADKLIETVSNYSRARSPRLESKENIKKRYKELEANIYDEDQLVNGHDLTNIIHILFKKVLKSKNKMLCDFNSIEDSLILSYEVNDFVRTNLFRNIFAWAEENQVQLFKENVLSTHFFINEGCKKLAN